MAITLTSALTLVTENPTQSLKANCQVASNLLEQNFFRVNRSCGWYSPLHTVSFFIYCHILVTAGVIFSTTMPCSYCYYTHTLKQLRAAYRRKCKPARSAFTLGWFITPKCHTVWMLSPLYTSKKLLINYFQTIVLVDRWKLEASLLVFPLGEHFSLFHALYCPFPCHMFPCISNMIGTIKTIPANYNVQQEVRYALKLYKFKTL